MSPTFRITRSRRPRQRFATRTVRGAASTRHNDNVRSATAHSASQQFGGSFLLGSFWQNLFIFNLPEGIMMVYGAVGAVTRAIPGWKRVVAGLGYALLIPAVRALVGDGSGAHVPILMAVFLLICIVGLRTSPLGAILATSIGFFLVAFGDYAVLMPLLQALDLSPEDVLETGAALIGWASMLPLALVFGLVYFRRLGPFLTPNAALRKGANIGVSKSHIQSRWP